MLGMNVMVYNVIVLSSFLFDATSTLLFFITPVHIFENTRLCCSMSVFEEQAEICKIILVWGEKLAASLLVVI